VTKVDLRREAWVCIDPVWWRPPQAKGFRLLDPEDRRALADGLSAHGRPPTDLPDHR
jgi:hypothetical protein